MIRRAALFSIACFVAGLLCLGQQPRAWWQSVQQITVVPPVAFSGPGDAVGGALVHWGAEAYNAAYATGLGKAFNVCDAGDAHCGDLLFGANGAVVDSTISGASGPCSSITCTIKIAYNHIANGTDDLANSTEAARPTIQFNCQGGRACMVFGNGKFLSKSGWNGAADVAPPWTISGAYIDTGTVDADGGSLLSTSSAGHASLYSNPNGTPNLVQTFAAGSVDATATNGVWHSVSGMVNGTSSADTNVDGVITLGNPGTRNLRQTIIYLGADDVPSNFIGQIGRMGVWATQFSSGNSTAMSASDHTFWGF